MIKERDFKSQLVDLTKDTSNHSMSFTYFKAEITIACYAITKMINKHCIVCGDVRKPTDPPSSTSIQTGLNERTKVFQDILAVFKPGVLTAIYDARYNTYHVELMGKTAHDLEALERWYVDAFKESNFYKGKCLKVGPGLTFQFAKTPNETLAGVILKPKLKEEFKLNVMDFLMEPRLHNVVKKRSVLLHGDPGLGKTSLVSAAFNMLTSNNITCIYISDESCFRGKEASVDQLFTFVNQYLTPALIVLEDIDLIAYDRRVGISETIGPLLSSLSGIEPYELPIVIVATTNRFDVLDKAIVRPCRFDRRLRFEYPTKEELNQLFKKFVGVEMPSNAKDLTQLTGAHVSEIADTAKLLAAKHNSNGITKYVESAVEIVKENFHIFKPSIGFNKGVEESTEIDSPKEMCSENSSDPFLAKR